MGKPEFIITFTAWNGARYTIIDNEEEANFEFERLNKIYENVHLFRAYKEK